MQRHLDYFSHFSAVGFPLRSQIEFERLLKMAFETGQAIPIPGGKYVVWEPGEGVQLWVKVKDRAVLGCAPHYSGEGKLQVEVQKFYARPENSAVTDGALLGTALSAFADSPPLPLVVDMPGFEETVSRTSLPRTVTVQATAFAREITCFPTADAFADWQSRQKEAPDARLESFLFPVLAERQPTSVAGSLVSAEARITGRVLKAQRRTNPITHQTFIALVVAIPGGSGTIDIAASPQAASGELLVGGLIQGTFWISGRIMPAASAPEIPERAAPRLAPMLSRLTGWARGGS